MPTNKSQIQMSMMEDEGEAMRADPKASQRFFVNSFWAASGRCH